MLKVISLLALKSIQKLLKHLKELLLHLFLSQVDINIQIVLADRIELVQLTQVIYEVIHILVCDAEKQPDPMAVSILLKCLHSKLVAVCLDTRASNASIIQYELFSAKCMSHKYILWSMVGRPLIMYFSPKSLVE